MLRNCLPLGVRPDMGWRAFILLAMVFVTVSGCQPSSPTAPGMSSPVPTVRLKAESQPITGGPVLLYEGITLRKVVGVGGGNIRLARNPVTGEVYMLNPATGLSQVDLGASGSTTELAPLNDITPDGAPSGMAFGPDGTLYVVVNREGGRKLTQAVIRKGAADASGHWTWTTLASTEPYAMSGTQFDHLFNGIVVSPDGQWVYVNSGSRTDHGEVQPNGRTFQDTREVALTSKIFRIPTQVVDLVLPNDEVALATQGLLFASGARNAYDLAFAPNGDLFAVDNGPDADYPDELNWIREGLHYGFPWRFGNQDNPQQFPGYDGQKDVRLSTDFVAVQTGTYRNDPTFPKPPSLLTDPVVNLGPDAAQYRGDDGNPHDAAAEGQPLYTFTPHRSPLGLVFATDPKLPVDFQSGDGSLSAFVLSWGAAGGTLSDKGQDLLHLALTKRGDNYEAVTAQIAREFKNPIDALMIENRLYVLEFGPDGAIWELTFE